ncbi:HNH endonuclease [Nonomuraea rubra]
MLLHFATAQHALPYPLGMPWKDQQGYVRMWHNGRDTRQHRVVAEEMLGRPLLPTEHVHHRNGVKDDNRPENLEVVDSRTHIVEHWQGGHYEPQVKAQTKPDAACSDCGWFGHLRAKGMCSRCYHRHYFRRNRAAGRA